MEILQAIRSKPARLYTDMLKDKYEGINVKVLRKMQLSREEVSKDSERITRTYAITTLNSEWRNNEEMVLIDQAIEQGEPVDSAFKRNGFLVRKNVLDVYVVSLSPWLRTEFQSVESFAKATNAELVVKKGSLIFNYAIMTEIYSPDFCKAKLDDTDHAQVNFSFHTLKAAGFSPGEIWSLTDPEEEVWTNLYDKL